MSTSTYVYVTYIATTPEKLWQAITDGAFTAQYFFGRRIESDWAAGSPVNYYRPNGDLDVFGEVLESTPYETLSYTWNVPMEGSHPTRVTFELLPMDETTVRLTLTHDGLLPEDWVEQGRGFMGYNNGWPAILSNLKSLLETGRTLPPIAAE